MAFRGFPEGGLAFLRELSEHNHRDWFEAHREVWDAQIVPAMLDWCAALTERLHDLMPALVFVPRVGGSLYRLNRDIRFSRDKRPYKTHVAALLWEGEEKHDSPGIYLHVSPEEVIFGGGIYLFEEARLDRWRKVLHDFDAAERLDAALQGNEQRMIEQALAEAEGRVSGSNGAAARLGVPASTLESKIRRFNIDKLRYRAGRQ